MRQLAVCLCIFTGVAIAIYWVLVFAGVIEVVDVIPGYRYWFMAFPLADVWIAICSLLAAVFLRKSDEKAVLFGLLSGSSLMFLGLYAVLYGVETGLMFNLTTYEVVEMLINIYCLSTGTFFIFFFWRLRTIRESLLDE